MIRTEPVHYEIEVLYGALFQPLCENNGNIDAFDRRDDVEMTDNDAEVTCRHCLSAMGYAA
jgi:hypothetical protein